MQVTRPPARCSIDNLSLGCSFPECRRCTLARSRHPTTMLSSRITSVLSASYADLEIRDVLETLDARGVRNTAETRRQVRLDVQKEVIQCNGEVVKDFGEVAEVCYLMYKYVSCTERC